MRKLDLVGKQFGKLHVIRYANSHDNYTYWECKCSCGNTCIVKGRDLVRGHKKSCGCLVSEVITERNSTHNKSKTRLYSIYAGIKKRCYTESTKNYYLYGGRGIKVCDEWNNDFMTFYNWAMANGYEDDLTIDRIDVNGNYCPENCRWVNSIIQNRNTRRNKLLTFNNETHCISEWSEITGIPNSTIRNRLNKGWKLDCVLSPINYRDKVRKICVK